MRLLIAEDDPRLLKSLLHIFTSNQYAADGVSNGTDALDYARTGEYDGFVFDIMMPGADGALDPAAGGDHHARPVSDRANRGGSAG